jgi:hypothetical protein
MFVEDMDAIVGSSRVTERILVLGDFNLLKVKWGGGGSRRMEDAPCCPWASRLIFRVI